MPLPRIKMTKLIFIIYFTALTAFGSIALANENCCNDGHTDKRQKHNFEKIVTELGLTDAQRAKAKVIFNANKEVVKPIIANLHAEQNILKTSIHADKIDETAIRAETAKISVSQANLNVNRAKVNAQFRTILTPEQLTTLKKHCIKNARKKTM